MVVHRVSVRVGLQLLGRTYTPRRHQPPSLNRRCREITVMGKRKKAAKKPTGPKKNEPLATSFSCLFCNHEKAVTCKLDKKAGIGSLSCKICGQQFQANINYLSHAIDVYSEWVDACDEVANPKDKPVSRSAGTARSSQQNRGRFDGAGEDDGDDLGDGYDGSSRPAIGANDDDDDDF